MFNETLRDLPPNDPIIRMLSGKTPFFASVADARFSFGLLIPDGHAFSGPELPLLVVIHGTRRQTGSYLNKLKAFSNEHSCVVLCPLFPAGIIDQGDVHNYKTILYKDIRFDLILLSMIEQAARIWCLKINKFFMHGFSGGGQFAHRFFYLHPERLAGVSIGAPGRFTPPDSETSWPAGLHDVPVLFGISNCPDFRAMAAVPVQFIVGEKDTDVSQLQVVKRPNAAESEAGGNRVQRIRWLHDAWEKVGVPSELTEVPGIGHDGIKCLPFVEKWLGPHIDNVRSQV